MMTHHVGVFERRDYQMITLYNKENRQKEEKYFNKFIKTVIKAPTNSSHNNK